MAHVKGPSQTNILLKHFSVKPSISGIEAAAMFRIRSLHRRILDLEAQGYEFRRERKVDTTGQRYVRYFYLGKKVERSIPLYEDVEATR
jgi:hypothetical protein